MQAKTIHSSYYILEALSQKNLLRTYGYFLKFKSMYSSSRLHDGNMRKLSRKCDVSYQTVRKHTKAMLRLGWIRVEDSGDWVFVSRKEFFRLLNISKEKLFLKCKIQISFRERISAVITKLASKLLEANLTRQEFIIESGHRYPNKSLGELDDKGKKIIQYRHVLFVGEASKVRLSVFGFGRLIGKGKSAGHALKKKMIDMGLIKAEPDYYLARDVKHDYNLFLKMKRRDPMLFYRLGKVYRRRADKISMAPPLLIA